MSNLIPQLSSWNQGASSPAPPASAPFSDATALVKGAADTSKLFRVDASALATATTRTVTPPAEDGQLALVGFGSFVGDASTPTSRTRAISGNALAVGRCLRFRAHGATGSATPALTLAGVDLFGPSVIAIADRWTVLGTITPINATDALIGWDAFDSTGGGSQNQHGTVVATGFDWTVSQDLVVSMPGGTVSFLGAERAFDGGMTGGSGSGGAGPWLPFPGSVSTTHTNSTAQALYRRNGDSLDVRYRWDYTNAPAAATLYFTPLVDLALTLNTSAILGDRITFAHGVLYDATGGTYPVRQLVGQLISASPDRLEPTAIGTAPNTLRAVDAGFPFTIANGDWGYLELNGIPILEWA